MPTTPRGRSSLLAAVVLILGVMLCVTALVALGRDPAVVVALALTIVPAGVSLIGIARTEALHNDLSNGLIREKLGEAVVEQAVAGNLAAIPDGSTPPAPPGKSG